MKDGSNARLIKSAMKSRAPEQPEPENKPAFSDILHRLELFERSLKGTLAEAGRMRDLIYLLAPELKPANKTTE